MQPLQRLDPPYEEAHLQTLALTSLQPPTKAHRKHQSCLKGTLGGTWTQAQASHCMVPTQYTQESTWNHLGNQTTSIQTCSSMSHLLLIVRRGREAGKTIPLGLRLELVNTDSKCCTPIRSLKKITTTTNQAHGTTNRNPMCLIRPRPLEIFPPEPRNRNLRVREGVRVS